MRERPILMSAPMVRAILEGRKTQTRRALNRNKLYNGFAFDDPRIARACPYGQAGDRLWVRETWAVVDTLDKINAAACYQYDRPPAVYYAAWTGAARNSPNRGRWRPSIHMPRWACRITLEITDVRTERVRDISEADAQAEGVQPDGRAAVDPHKYAYKRLWDEINAKRGYGWASNPWVWVIEFKQVQT